MDDGNLNFSNYSQADLEECLLSINSSTFPKNYQALIDEVALRKSSGAWDEAQSRFNEVFQIRRAAVYLLWLLYIPAWLALRIGYRFFTGHDLPHAVALIFCISFIVMFGFAKWRLSKVTKPR